MWNSLLGYVIVQVEGLGLERFLNRAMGDGVRLSNVRRISRTQMTMEMSARDFIEKIPPVRRKYRCRVRILKRKGIPFVLARFRWRKLLVVGCGLMSALLLFASTRLFFISVEGCYQVPEAVVRRALEEAGVAIGNPIADVENASLGRFVRSYDQRIAWAGVEKRGVTLTVEIVEAEPLPKFVAEDAPADVVATKDGLVEKVTALYGKPSVAPGEAVREGEVLIRGDITREGGAQMLVHAKGSVMARVWYMGKTTCPATQTKLLDTGNSAEYMSLTVAGFSVRQTPCPYAYGRLELDTASALNGLILPVKIARGRWIEQAMGEVPAVLEEQLAFAAFEAELSAFEQLPQDALILEKRASTEIHPDGRVTGIVEICALEEIGATKALYFAPEG